MIDVRISINFSHSAVPLSKTCWRALACFEIHLDLARYLSSSPQESDLGFLYEAADCRSTSDLRVILRLFSESARATFGGS